MADRIKLIIQKRTSLKSQITNLANLLDKGKIDKATLKLRIARVTELYHAYEDYNDELAVLDSSDIHQNEFANIQERYYTLAGKVENIVNAADALNTNIDVSNNEVQNNESEVITSIKKRRIKLPELPLPKFDGKYENWLSFKNAFHSIIDSQSELSDIDKLHYLKSALIGDAANKVKIFVIDGMNYSKAWEILERSYEVKRVLITRHLSYIINLPAIDKESVNGLSKLADDTQQHIASLAVLGVSVGPEMVVHILESKLPRITLEKWEATLERDEYPTLDQMYEFLYKTAVCASKRERSRMIGAETTGEPSNKKRYAPSTKYGPPTNKAFVLSTLHNCIICKTKCHPLHLCGKFKQMPVPKRIETVRNAKICYNCLRSHLGRPCRSSGCTVCQKRHNTLLHLKDDATENKSESIQTSDTQSA